MHTFLRHQYELLTIDIKIVDYQMQQHIWSSVNDIETVKYYQDAINKYELKKEQYLNNLLISLTKTKITPINATEIKRCYELIEMHSKQHTSNLFKVRLYKIIEEHQKKHSDYLLKNQLRKVIETERIIYKLEKIY